MDESPRAHRVQVLSHKDSLKGGWLEHLKDEDPHYVQQSFLPSQRQGHREIVDAFGSANPHSSSVVLQYAGDPEQKTQSTPATSTAIPCKTSEPATGP